MSDPDLVKMVHGLEASIKSLKHHLGISESPSQAELDEGSEPAEPAIKEVGRGRKKRTVPTIGKSMDDELGEGEAK